MVSSSTNSDRHPTAGSLVPADPGHLSFMRRPCNRLQLQSSSDSGVVA